MTHGASSGDLARWAEALSGIARTGLGFTENLYERERFEEVLRVAADIKVVADSQAVLGAGGRADGSPHELSSETPSPGNPSPGNPSPEDPSPEEPSPEEIVGEWLASVGRGVAGYVTPKVAVGAVVGNDHHELLLVKRADSGAWLYPTGWADVGYSASEVVVKEVREETGIDAEPLKLMAVVDGLRAGFNRVPLYSLVFLCRANGGELSAHPLECADVGWFSEDRLPSPLAGGSRWLPQALAAVRGEPFEVLFDRPRRPPWRGMA
jgi:ADP-ribose pyrophosphatase YjhB (NUDIX family)